MPLFWLLIFVTATLQFRARTNSESESECMKERVKTAAAEEAVSVSELAQEALTQPLRNPLQAEYGHPTHFSMNSQVADKYEHPTH